MLRSQSDPREGLGPDHIHTALSLVNLAGLLETLGDVTGELPLYERPLAIYVSWPERGGLEVLFNRQYEAIWQRMPGYAAEPADPVERIARWGNRWFYDECCGIPRRPPPRKSQETEALLVAALALFIAGKDVSQLLLPTGPIPRLVRRYQVRMAETDI